MKFMPAIFNLLFVILFIAPLLFLYLDFASSLQDGLFTLFGYFCIALAVFLKAKYRNKK